MSSPAQPPASLDEFLVYARVTMAALYPGRNLESVVLVFGENCQMNLFVPTSGTSPGGWSHSPDYRQVRVGAATYQFTPSQAAVVRVLWEARDSGCPGVGCATLLELAGSEATRLRDLFRGHPAWDDGFISPTGKGVYALLSPGEVE